MNGFIGRTINIIRQYVKLAFRFLLTAGFSIVITGCGNPTNTSAETSPKERKRTLYGADSLEEAIGVFYRIQASYEVIKTGEPIDFDFIVSCYNRDVPGSFHGMIKPTTMFKATKDGAAVAIAPPKFYCERGLRGEQIEQENDKWKMPMLAWYPDVNDLSFALIYASNDAYTGPKAEVKFQYYKVTPSDRKSFHSWQEQTEAEYEQIGAIPGPFGCSHFDVGMADPYNCSHEITKAKNGSKNFALPEEELKFATFVPFPEISTSPLAKEYNVDGRFFCFGGINPKNGEKWGFERKATKDVKRLLSELHFSQFNKHFVYLDPAELNNKTETVQIRTVYPLVSQKHPLHPEGEEIPRGLTSKSAIISQVLTNDEWKGFAVKNSSNSGFESFIDGEPAPEYAGLNRGVFFVQDRLACEFESAQQSTNIFDVENGKFIRVGPGGSINTKW